MAEKLRLIQNPLAKATKLRLRKIFNIANELRPLAREKTLLNTLGYANANEMYYALAETYNHDILQEREATKVVRVRDKRQQKLRRIEAVKSKIVKIESPDLTKLRNTLKQYKGKSVVVEYIIEANTHILERVKIAKVHYDKYPIRTIGDKFLIRNREYQIPENFRSWWKKTSHEWFYTYDVNIFSYFSSIGNVFIYPQNENINTEKVIQLFRDGISHCVFTPIRNWAIAKLDEANTKKTKYRYSGMIKKLDNFIETYKDGLPETNVSEICNALQIDVTIELPFCENRFIEAQSLKKRLKLFRFMNTRLNHIELNEVVKTDEFEIVTRRELLQIIHKLDDSNEFYTYKKDNKNICSISTLTKTYKLSNEFSETIKEFEIENGLNFCKIDDIDDAVLSKFIHEGTNYNSTVDFVDVSRICNERYGIVESESEIVYCEFDKKPVNHIDMKKAYANFKSCKYYSGFLGKITDFRQTDKINGIGMYLITDLQIPDGKFYDYNSKLRIYLSNNIYTSVELQMLDSYGATYKIVSGCWGVKPIDFEFNDVMLTKTDDEGIKFYSKWAGVCDQHKLEKKFWIKGNFEYFQVIREQCGNGIVRFYNNGEGCIGFPKKHNYHLGHITAFITAYQRMNMIEQLMEIDYKNVIRVCVDGIYHTQEEVELKNVFRPKQEKRFSNEAGSGYVDKAFEQDLVINEVSDRIHYAKELHLGAGGCGKTHYNLNDKGLVRVMFLAPSWKLARSKRNESGINCSVWARALSSDPEKITAIKESSNVLIIDEISMLSETDKNKLFSVYSDMKIIMCGDLGYQLPCIEGEEADAKGFDNIQYHNNNYRCKDEKLGAILETLRSMIAANRSRPEINNWVMSKFKELERVIGEDELKNTYTINDMVLSGTNELKDYYTSLFAGKFDTEKYYIMENNRLYCNGDIVIGVKPEHCKCEIRHCFTTHSIQGETANYNLFIDSSKMFDSRMFYTAISRAKTLDQIYIVENKKHTFKYEYGKIYKIVSESGVYIGSTVKQLEKRFEEHKNGFAEYKKNGGKFITSYALLNDKDVKIEKLESFRCNDLKDLWKREAEIIQQYGNKCVNKTFNEHKE